MWDIVTTWVEEHLGQPVTLSWTASEVDVSGSRLCELDEQVRVELEALLCNARAVGAAAKRAPDRADSVDGGRGYLGGALTTMHHLDLLTDAEHEE